MSGKNPAVDHRSEIVAVEQRMSRTRQRLLCRFDGILQAGQWQRLQRVELAPTQSEMRQHGVGETRRALPPGKAHAGAALHNRLMEETLGTRHCQQRADLSATAGLTKDRDVARVAAEASGVFAPPL